MAVGFVLFFGGFAVTALLYQPFAVPTNSMAPTVARRDRVLAERIGGDEVRRGDVVVFEDPDWGDATMIKRVVGVGGDTVACCDGRGRITVNGEPVTEAYLDAESGRATQEFESVVPEGELFLLGDHRGDSLDSRSMLDGSGGGSVPRGAVSARVEAVAWPLGRAGLLERPEGFAGLPGGISERGPLGPLVLAVAGGAVLVFGAGLYGPCARWRAARRDRRAVRASRVAHNEGTHG
jgi:signal peptidase I